MGTTEQASRKEVKPAVTHTPGPWFADRFGDVWAETGIDQCEKRTVDICAIERDRHETPGLWEANARLIAAAPELLNALKHLMLSAAAVSSLLSECEYRPDRATELCDLDDVLQAAQAAVEKAEDRA